MARAPLSAADAHAQKQNGRGDGRAEGTDSSGGIRSLHEKLESVYVSDDSSSSELPPQIFHSGFDAAIQQQSAAFRELSARVERVENGEIADLRLTMREMYDVISGIALETERCANETTKKIEVLAHSVELLVQRESAAFVSGDDLADTLMTLKNQILKDTNLTLDRHRADLSDAQTAIVALKDHRVRVEERIAALDKRDEDLSRSISTLGGSIVNDTSNALRSQLARVEQAEKAISRIQENDVRSADHLSVLDTRDEELSRHIATFKQEIAALHRGDLMAAERAEALQADTENIARDLTEIKSELVELHEIPGVMQAHQRVLEQTEGDIVELKDRQTRSAMRAEALGGRHTELVGELRLLRADLEESNSVLRAHQKAMLEQSEKGFNELKDRQTQSASRIEGLDRRQEELASELQLTGTDLKETANAVQVHHVILEETGKALSKYKDHQVQSLSRFEVLDGRQQELTTELRQTKASLERSAITAQTQQAALDQVERTVNDLKGRQARTATQIEDLFEYKGELSGNLRLLQTALQETGATVNAHQTELQEGGKAITEIKDRQARSNLRIEAMERQQEALSEDISVVKAGLEPLTDIPGQLRGHQALLGEAEKVISELKDRQFRATSRIEMMDSRQAVMSDALSLLEAGLGALSDAPNLLRSHQVLLDETERSITELKDRHARSVSRFDVMSRCQEDLSAELSVVKTGLGCLSETPNLLRAHQALLDGTEKAINEVKERHTQSVVRIERLDGIQNDLSGEVSIMKAGLAVLGETPNFIRAHQTVLDESEKAIAELKIGQTHALLRIEKVDARQEKLAGDLDATRVVLETFSDTSDRVRAHQALLSETEKTIAELKERQSRATSRFEVMDSRQNQLSGELSLVKTGLGALGDTPSIQRAHQLLLDEAGKGISEIKDQQLRAISRIETIDNRQEDMSGELSLVKAGVGGLSETPSLLRAHRALLDESERGISELKDRLARAALRIETTNNRQEDLSAELTTVKAGLAAVSDAPNQLRAHQTLLDGTEKSAAELKDRQAQLASRLELVGNCYTDLSAELSIVKTGLGILSDTPSMLRAHRALLDESEKSIVEIKDRNARSALRIESMATNFSDLSDRLDAQRQDTRLIDERLHETERTIAQSQDRERALAKLHARAADALGGSEMG